MAATLWQSCLRAMAPHSCCWSMSCVMTHLWPVCLRIYVRRSHNDMGMMGGGYGGGMGGGMGGMGGGMGGGGMTEV